MLTSYNQVDKTVDHLPIIVLMRKRLLNFHSHLIALVLTLIICGSFHPHHQCDCDIIELSPRHKFIFKLKVLIFHNPSELSLTSSPLYLQ